MVGTVKRSKVMCHASMKRALTKRAMQAEAKAIVPHVDARNPYEAWRRLYGRFDPGIIRRHRPSS